jgi:Tfp pilus assembly protein PilX
MRLMPSPATLRSWSARQDGYSMIVVLFVMVAAATFVAAGFAAADGELPVSRISQERKIAYAAAESGVSYYKFKLDADPDSWARCAQQDPAAPTPINQPGTVPARWRSVPGSTAQYTIELVPAPGFTQCVANNATSIIDPQTGAIRIRVTGRPSPTSSVRRTIMASFRRDSFLDYLYFTDLETLDPAAYPSTGTPNSTWADSNCKVPRASRPDACEEITFWGFDRINGPFHTNDDLQTCGSPVFGRSAADAIEVSGPSPGWSSQGGTACAGAPVFTTPLVTGANRLDAPPNNAKLAAVAQPAYLFTGKTTIRFNSTGGMTVTNPFKNGGAATNMALPPNGVIYVKNGTGSSASSPACTGTTSPKQATYTESNGCAEVYVSGTYTGNVTIGSALDIIVSAPDGTTNGDLVRADDSVVLGLIADKYVRVAHPVSSGVNVTTGTGRRTMQNVRIDAAILSLQHSFIVDNYNQGAKLGTLTVNGAIAQKFRGPVGTNVPSGYEKNYNYDDRLRYRTPPFFLDPVAASWNLTRTNEQIPAAPTA